jgi:hypothetical protein
MYLGLEPAAQYVSEYYQWFLIAMLGVYVPGKLSILYLNNENTNALHRKLRSLHPHDDTETKGDAWEEPC